LQLVFCASKQGDDEAFGDKAAGDGFSYSGAGTDDGFDGLFLRVVGHGCEESDGVKDEG
jgi:hypothetical protein